MSDEVLIKAENIGKKFCRSLKRSLWYGVKDIARDINPFSGNEENQEPGTRNQEQGTRHKAQETRHQAPALRADEFWALQNISFELKRGECLGLIGHNGAGKSTLLKILNGLIRPDTGKLTMRGRVGALIELSAGFNPILTGRENIYNRGALLGFTRPEIDRKFDEIVDFAEIGEFLDMPVQNYSSGMQVRLGFAVSAQMEPDVLILDEVLAVGDVAFRFKCLNAMSRILRNSAVVFVSHTMPQVFRVSSEVMVLSHGKSIYSGTDIGHGISLYHEQGSTLSTEIGGNGAVAVASCRISAGEHSARLGGILELAGSAPLDLELDLVFLDSVDTARVQVVFWNPEMIPVADIVGSADRGHLVTCPEESRRCRVRLAIPELAFNGGTYQASICLTSDPGDIVYSRHDNAFAIRMLRHNGSGANLVVPGTWH